MEIFHVLNRGVEKIDVVLDDSDRLRFVHSLFVFNDSSAVDENHRHPGWHLPANKRDKLVHIHAWCLMDNHYHILLSAVNDDVTKLSLFMKKLNGGYAKYFNEKYDRSGYLWQGRYRKISVERDCHFIHVPYYIHCNPLDYKFPEWRNGKVKNIKAAIKYLKEYRWSSHLDYTGIKNFSSIIEMDRKNFGKKDGAIGIPKHYSEELAKLIGKSGSFRGNNTI
jgi:putative transposase